MISNKQDFLKFIKGAGVGLYGAPAAQSTVKFQYTTNLATAATNDTAGALTFAVDANGNAGIWAQGALVSSAIQKVEAAAATGNKHGGKTITVTYIVANTGAVTTSTFDVIDEAALEAYFSGSKTITLDASTDKYEVKLKENGGLAVDPDNGIYAVLDNIFAVDGKTIAFKNDNKTIETKVKIAYVAADEQTGQKAAIQLQDVDSTKLSEVTVESLIGSGIVSSTSYDAATNTLTINWVGGATTTINLTDIFDISDWAVKTGSTDYLTLDISTAGGSAEIGVTDKVKTGITLAESAIQAVEKGTSVENYVSLSVADHATDASTKVISIDGTSLNTKISEIDGSIGDISTRLHDYSVAADASIDRLDSSVNLIETAIADMNANLSANILDGSIGITLVETEGKVTSIGVTATEADTTFTAATDAEHPATLTSTSGLLTGAAIADIVSYVNAKSGALDSSVTGQDSPNGFVKVNTVQTDGALSAENVTVVYGDYAEPQNNGIATTSTTKTYVDAEISNAINALDLAATVADASAADAAGFVKTTISETNGIVKNESVEVTYGNYSTHTNGIAKTADTSVFVEEQIAAALTWTVLS